MAQEEGVQRYILGSPNLIGELDIRPGGEGIAPREDIASGVHEPYMDVRGQLPLPLSVPPVDFQGNRMLRLGGYETA